MSSRLGRAHRAPGAGAGPSGRLAVITFAALLLLTASGSARSSSVPASVQATLISKVADFDRSFRARAGKRALVLIVQAKDNAESAREATLIKAALAGLPTVGGLPHEEQTVTYGSAPELAETVRSRRVAIVYFGSGMSGQVQAIRNELSSVDVLTVTAVPGDVPGGIVLGVDLVSGRPKLLLNLTQARKQNVALPASVLKLMEIYQQ